MQSTKLWIDIIYLINIAALSLIMLINGILENYPQTCILQSEAFSGCKIYCIYVTVSRINGKICNFGLELPVFIWNGLEVEKIKPLNLIAGNCFLKGTKNRVMKFRKYKPPFPSVS